RQPSSTTPSQLLSRVSQTSEALLLTLGLRSLQSSPPQLGEGSPSPSRSQSFTTLPPPPPLPPNSSRPPLPPPPRTRPVLPLEQAAAAMRTQQATIRCDRASWTFMIDDLPAPPRSPAGVHPSLEKVQAAGG